MEVCLFLCPLEIFPLVRDVSQPVCLPLFLCVRTCRRVFVCVCVYIVEEQVCSIVISKQFISAKFGIAHV